VSELHDRLERLAGRGTPRGADEVLRAAQRSAPREIGVIAPTGDDRDLDIIDDLPYVSAAPARRRGRFSALIAATGVAALAGVGILAVSAMFGSGGADSPEAAVRQLAGAVSHEDPLAAVDVLSPSEVRSMRESVQHISDRAADLKLVDKASAPLAGVDLSVDDLQLSAADVGDGFAKVTVTGGTISASTHIAALSTLLRDAAHDAKDTQGKADLARLGADSDLPTFVMTVRHDGRCYVSPAYTALEYARLADKGPAADFGSADASKLGADTPQHAVEDALHAWQQSDWNRLIALAPPDELPVYDYRAWIGRNAADMHSEFTIDELTTSADVSGDRGVVRLEASGTMGSPGDRGRWQVGGTCQSLGADANVWRNSYDDQPSGLSLCLAGSSGATIPFGLFQVDPAPEGSATGPVSIRVVREDGRWFVSPVGTVLGIVDDFVQHVDERTLYPLMNLGYLLPPDGSLTLNEPLRITEKTHFGEVISFDGKAGQKIVGQTEGAKSQYFYLSAQVFTADGRDVGYVDFQPKGPDQCCGYTQTLPTTGSYRLVIMEPLPAGLTLTLFDADHAPKKLLDNGFPGEGDGCTYTANSVSCSGQAEAPLSGVTPTTAGAGQGQVTDTTAGPATKEITANPSR
jgi:hypothetical protein